MSRTPISHPPMVAAGAVVKKRAHEHFSTVHRSSGRDFATDDGGFARRSRRIYAASGFGTASSRLSHDTNRDFLSGRKPGSDGFFRDGATGTPVRAGARIEADDFDQLVWMFDHNTAILAGPQHRYRRTIGPGGHQCRQYIPAEGSAEPADLQQSQSRGHACPYTGSKFQ